MSALGFAHAVTEAVRFGTDHWLLYMPRRIGKRSGKPRGSLLAPLTERAMQSTTHDEIDAAHMRLCNHDDDLIRQIFREGM